MPVKTKEDVAAVNDNVKSYIRQHGLGLIRARAAHDPKYALLNSAINEILEIIRNINTCDDDSQDVSYLIYYLDRRYEAFRRYTAVLPYIRGDFRALS